MFEAIGADIKGVVNRISAIEARFSGSVPGTPIAVYASSKIIAAFSGPVAIQALGVWSWVDQSGNGYNLTAERPGGVSFSTVSGFKFSFIGNSLRRAALPLSSNYSVYILAEAALPCKGSLFVNGGLWPSPETGLSFGVGASQHQDLGTAYRALVQGLAWGAPITIGAEQNLYRAYRRAGQSIIALNDGSELVSSSVTPSASTGGTLSIGGHTSAGSLNRYFTGAIKAVVVYDYDTVSSGEDVAIRSFLQALWAAY